MNPETCTQSKKGGKRKRLNYKLIIKQGPRPLLINQMAVLPASFEEIR